MQKITQADAAKRLSLLEIITLLLSIYVLIALLIQALFPLTPDAVALLDWVDLFVCVVFLTDFFVNLARAPSKRAYLIKWGWIDFLSSIPMLPAFRVGRVVRIVRVLRVLRAFRSAKNLLVYLLRVRKVTSLVSSCDGVTDHGHFLCDSDATV
jgi:voltage-gated potassium channel